MRIDAQDQVFNIKYHSTKMQRNADDSKCKMCQQFDETVQHLIAGCPALAKEENIKHHDRVRTQINYFLESVNKQE
jgi:hypothetical protein